LDASIARGLTLSERLNAYGRAKIGKAEAGADYTLEAIARCRSWFRRENRGRDEWATLLAQSCVTEQELVDLARWTDGIAVAPPSWSGTAERLLTFLHSRHFAVSPRDSIEHNVSSPVVRFAAEELWNSAGDKHQQLFSESAKESLERTLGRQLAWSVSGIVEFELGRKLPRSDGEAGKRDNADAVTAFFFNDVAAETNRLLNNYSVLLRLWSRQVENWQAFMADFVKNVESFVAANISPGRSREPIIRQVGGFLSDPHDGGRSVIAVDFSNRATWYYKPRSGSHELGWFRLLAWVNAQGFPAPFRVVGVRCGERHCWMDNVRAQGVSTRSAAYGYYFRAGALLYLTHILRAADLHAGNVIASGNQPVIVDCETLLHVQTRIPAVGRASARDILRTGMLPLGRGRDPQPDPSALGRLERGAHRLTMNSKPVPVEKYLNAIEHGFMTMHHFLHGSVRMRTAFERKVRHFLPERGRRIYRPTAHYFEILRFSHGAGTMINGLYRSLLFEALCRDGATPRSCVAHEVSALEEGDIPLFVGSAAAPRPPLSDRALHRSISILHEAILESVQAGY
jgi:lantibiotic modifying enzyme